ncbi:MAG: DNA alkylation repair protein [Verrucomicrobiota bacterium]
MPAKKTARKRAAATAGMTCAEVMKKLKALGNAQTRTIYRRHGAPDSLFGVKIGDMKPLAKRIRKDHEMALELFATENPDAQYFAGMIADDPMMKKTDLNKWARTASWSMVSTCTVAWVAAESGKGLDVSLKWIDATAEKVRTSGWSTLSAYLSMTPDEEIDFSLFKKLITRVARGIHEAPNREKDSMNSFLIAAGCFCVPLMEPALKAAAKIGKVEVDVGETNCKVPDATEYIRKVEKMGRIGKKKKTAKC